MVPLEAKELLLVSKDVVGDFDVGDFGTGRLFCSFAIPVSFLLAFTGDFETYPAPATGFLRYFSWLVRPGAGCVLSAGSWSNLVAISFTLPVWREGRNAGFDLALFSPWDVEEAGPETDRSWGRVGEREKERETGTSDGAWV